MNISKSIVRLVNTQLNPPGRFLEKSSDTGLWHEVDEKRAIEKPSQALRDGAAPLRKQLAEDLSQVFNSSSSSSDVKKTNKKRVIDDSASRSSKKQRTIKSSNIATNTTSSEKFNRKESTQHLTQKQKWIQGNSNSSSSCSKVGSCQEEQQKTTRNQNKQLAQALSFAYMQQISALNNNQQQLLPDTMISNQHQPLSPVAVQSCNHVNYLAETTTSSSSSQHQQLLQDKQRIDNEEFLLEMGPDEHFFALGTSEPLVGGSAGTFEEEDDIETIDEGDCVDDNLFDSVLDSMFDDVSTVTP